MVVQSGSLLEEMDPPVNPSKEIDDPSDKKPEDWVDEAKIPDASAGVRGGAARARARACVSCVPRLTHDTDCAVKPDDWNEAEPAEILDEDAVKPAGWLDEEPDNVPDATAVEPEDWDEDEARARGGGGGGVCGCGRVPF